MNSDIKDMKPWADRHDVNVGDKGYFTHNINWLKDDFELNVDTIACIRDDFGNCFVSEKSFNDGNSFPFFVPLKAVKEDKPKEKKYRPFKTMRELTEVVRGKDWEYNDLSVGDSLLIRHKGDEHYHQNILITSLGYDENDLISMNGRLMQDWLDKFEFLAHCEWRPFGVEEND